MAKAFDLDKWSAMYAANPLNPDRGLNSSYWEINPNDTMTTDEAMTKQAAKEQQAQEPNSIVGLLGNNGNTAADYGYDSEGGDDFITFNKNRPGIKSLLGGIGMLAAAPIAGGAAAAGLAAGASVMDDPGDFSRKVFNSIPDHSDIEHSALAEAFQTSDDITAEKIRIANVLGLNPDYVTTANREDYQSFARAAEQIEKLSALKKYQKPDGGIDFDRLYSEIPGLAEVQRTKGNAAAALLLANPEVTKSIKDVYDGSFGRIMGSIAAGWNRGTAQRAINLIYADMEREGRREPTAVEAKRLKDLNDYLKAQPKNSYSGYADTLGGVLGAAVENLPMMGASQIAGGLGAAGVYYAAKNPTWAKWAYNLAATAEMAYEISGNQYQENAQAVNANGEYKYTTGQAASLSAAQGLAEAVLEQWTIRDMLGAVFGRSKSVGDLVSIYKQHGFTEEGKALAKATAKEKIKEYAKVSGVSMGSELREEFLQSIADNAIENVWQAGINGRNGEYTSFNDMLAEGVGAAIEAVPAVAGFGIVGGSMHGAANAKKILGFRDNIESNIRENVARHSVITAQYNELIANMQLAVKDSKKIPEDVLTAALDAENEKRGMADSEVDISSLAKEEGGAEIVSMLCQAAGIPEETKQRLLTMQTPATVKTSVLMQMGALSPEQQEKLNNHTAPVNGYTPAMLANERQAMQLKIEAIRKAGADKVNNAVERIMSHEAMAGLTDGQKELAREVVTGGFGNPLKMVDLRMKEARKTIRAILQPIIDGLKAEGGHGTVVIPKEVGSDLFLEGGIRVSENAPWYQQFYKDNGRAPSAFDLQQIATAYVIPEVDSKYLPDEIARLSPDQYDAVEADILRKALAEKKDLEEIKNRLEKIDPGTLTMSDILSEDGQKVFNYFMKAHGSGNKDVQRAASVDALLGALMYQRLKEYYDKLGKEYSAENFILRTQVEAGGALISADDIQVQKDGDLVVKGLKVHPDFVEGNKITGNVKGLLDKIAGILDSEEPQNAMALRSFIPADIADGFLNAMQENDIERAKKIVSDKAAAMDEVYNQITVPLNLDEQIEILDFDKIQDLAMNNRELIEYLKDLPKQEIMSADLRAIVGLPENSDKIGQKHLVFNKSTYKDKNRVATRKTLNSFSDVIANARLVEVEPNTKVRDYSGMNPNQRKKQTRKNSVPNYYRFFVPIRLNGETYTLVISAEETAAQNGKAAKTRAYEIFTVKNGKKRLPAPQRFDRNTPSDSVSGAGNTVSIRETLANVKDRNGNYYINEDGTGNFAPNVTVLNQVSTEQNTLVGVHNLSAANLRHVLKMGGLANPSIGIVDTTKQALEGYGEITLIAPTPLIDKSTGRNAGTYAADIYSPRYPSVDVELTDKAYKEITQRVRDALKKDSVASILSNIEDNAKDLTYSRALKSLFIAEKYGELEADGYSYIREHNLQQEFEEYARHFLDGYDVKERIFNGYTPSGNRKYIAHTLANVSKFMKKQGRQGGEGFNYGLGNFRALLAPKATSTKQIKKWKNRLQDRETFTTIKKELNEEFYRFSEIAGGRYGADAGEERLAEAVRLRRDIPSYLESECGVYMSDEDANDLRAFVAKLSEMPTEYFETKFERPVMLNEFAGALVPHDLPADLKDVLKENALQVYEYDREGDRTKALADATKDLAQRRKVLFQAAYHGSPYDFDRFDLGAIGTGEGAQAHGWGLYFAEDRKVSEMYKEVLSNAKGEITIHFRGEKYHVDEDGLSYVNENSGEFVKAKSPLELALDLISDIDDLINDAEGSIERAISKLQSHIEFIGGLKERDPELYEAYANTLKNYEEAKNLLTNRDEWNIEKSKGVLYEVDVPESSVMLDEDKPLYEQPAQVRRAIVEYYKSRPDYYTVPEGEDVLGSSDGKAFYKDVVFQMRQEGSLTPEKDASLLLKSFGIEGITYEGGRDGRCFVVFDDKAVSIIEKYNQAVNGNAVKGSTVFQSNGQRIIQLFEGADESTFLHEMSHIYLDELKQLAEMAPDSDAGKDYATIMAWASYKEGASAEYAGTATASEFAGREAEIRQAMRDGFIERKVDGTAVTVTKDQLLAEWAQERFARGFEAYLQSGEAPTSSLKKAFRNLKKWLNKIYKAVTGNGKVAAQPSEDVKRIMDRMLASEEQIELAAAEMLLNSTDEEIAERAQAKELQDKLLAEAKAEAEERMLKKLLKQNIKKAKEDYIAKRREELREELYDDNRCYQAELMVEDMGEQAAMEICGYDSVDEWKAELADAMGSLEAGVKFYLDGELEQLDESFLNVEQLREQAKQELASTEVMAELVNLQKEIYARLDLKHEREAEREELKKKLKGKFKEQRKKTWLRQTAWLRGIRDALKGKVKVQRQAARGIMATLPIREATATANYWRQMDKAGKAAVRAIAKAIRKNSNEEAQRAAMAKEDQGRYAALYKESLKAKATVNKVLLEINKLVKAVRKKDSHVGPEYRYFFDRLMYAYGFIDNVPVRPSTLEGVSFQDFIDSQHNELDGDVPPMKLSDFISPEILAAIESNEVTDYRQRKNRYKDLTIDQLATINHVAKIIRHWGINSNSRLTDGKSFDEIAGELYTSAMENCDVKTRDDKVNHVKNTLGGYIANILKPEMVLNILGGRGGKWVTHIYNILFDATEQKRILKEQTNDQMTKLITACYGKGWNRWKIQRKWKNKIPTAKLATGAVLTKEQVICMALNWGNADNRKKLCDGFNMAEDSVKAILDRHMEKRDWRFVQGVWNILEGLGDKVSLVTEKEYGLPMQRIKADPFTVGDMTLAGGYYPIAYRRDGNPRADAKQELEEKKSLTGALALGTGMGQTKSRTSSVPIAPLRLDLAVLDKHINQSCHIATMRLACRDVFKTLNQPGVAQAVVDIFGDKVYRMLKQWVTDCWAEPPGTEGIERWAGKLRSNTVSAIMAYRLSTAVLNFANILPTIDVLGAKGTLEALMMFARHPMRIGEKWRFVLADSAWMRDRANNLDRDLSKVSDNLFDPDNPALHGINKFSSWLLEATDMLTTVPVYYYTYQTTFNEEIERGTEAEEAHRIAHRKAHENVRSIVGSADTVDTAAISRSKHEFVKAITPFYSFANTMGNAVYGKALAGYYKGGKATFAERYGDFVKSFMLRYLLMSLMETAIRAGIDILTSGDGDEDKYRDLNAFLLEWAKNSVSSATGAFYVANLFIEAGMDGWLNETSRGRSSISVLGGTWNRFTEARDQTRKFNEGKTDFIDFGRSLTKVGTAATGFSDTIADSLWNSLRFIEDDYRFDNMSDLREYVAKTLFDRKLKKKG